jgi:PAS domain S-box-containing protein
MHDGLKSLFAESGFMPHIHCYLAKPSLVWTMFITDTFIGLAYTGISITLYVLVRRIRIPFTAVVLCFGVFIGACGATHFMEVWTLWNPNYWWSAFVKGVTAIASVGTGIYLFRLRHAIVTVAEAAKLSEQRRLDLEVMTGDLEKRVKERTEHLQLALQSTNLGTWELDLQTGRLIWDRRTEEIFGYPPGEFPGTYDAFSQRVHPDDRNRVLTSLDWAIQNQKSFKREYRILWPDDTLLWVSAQGRPKYASDGTPVSIIGTSLDITQSKQYEIELMNAVHTRDEFLSIVSHELRTPITSMKMQAQITKRSIARNDLNALAPDRVEKLVNQLDRQLDRLTRLVDDMLDLSRLNTGKLTISPERVELCSLIYEMVERFHAQFESARCPVSIDCSDEIVGMWDRFRIEQVVANLLTNAIRYGAGKAVSIKLQKEDQAAILKVRDEGIGIAKKDQQRIFQRFERAVSATEISGLGLGLYIVQQIVEMHGGTISVESEIGKGSVFIVNLSTNHHPLSH